MVPVAHWPNVTSPMCCGGTSLRASRATNQRAVSWPRPLENLEAEVRGQGSPKVDCCPSKPPISGGSKVQSPGFLYVHVDGLVVGPWLAPNVYMFGGLGLPLPTRSRQQIFENELIDRLKHIYSSVPCPFGGLIMFPGLSRFVVVILDQLVAARLLCHAVLS